MKLDDYTVLDITRLLRMLHSKCEEALFFCQNWLDSPGSRTMGLRNDYKELMLVIIFLGGTIESRKFQFQVPGALFHARWMAKLIYCIKICLFYAQLAESEVFSEKLLQEVRSLVIFLVLYHIKPWFTCSSAVDAPFNDLQLHKTLQEDLIVFEKSKDQYPPLFFDVAQAYLHKFDNHLWYLSERLSVLSLFSSKVTVSEKKSIAQRLLKYKETPSMQVQQMPVIDASTKLKDLIGNDSWTFFRLININHSFLKKDPKFWENDEC